MRKFPPQMIIVAGQVRAARSFLDWSQRVLADKAAVPLSAVKAFEAGADVRISVMDKIATALFSAGILFLDEGDTRSGGAGVRLR